MAVSLTRLYELSQGISLLPGATINSRSIERVNRQSVSSTFFGWIIILIELSLLISKTFLITIKE
ncbi:MAG: hypothetical protein Q8O98_01405 [bacterium]|nr:hypothetical protein [bacterium]